MSTNIPEIADLVWSFVKKNTAPEKHEQLSEELVDLFYSTGSDIEIYESDLYKMVNRRRHPEDYL